MLRVVKRNLPALLAGLQIGRKLARRSSFWKSGFRIHSCGFDAVAGLEREELRARSRGPPPSAAARDSAQTVRDDAALLPAVLAVKAAAGAKQAVGRPTARHRRGVWQPVLVGAKPRNPDCGQVSSRSRLTMPSCIRRANTKTEPDVLMKRLPRQHDSCWQRSAPVPTPGRARRATGRASAGAVASAATSRSRAPTSSKPPIKPRCDGWQATASPVIDQPPADPRHASPGRRGTTADRRPAPPSRSCSRARPARHTSRCR